MITLASRLTLSPAAGGKGNGLGSLIIRGFSAADLAELAAPDDRLDRGADAEIMCLESACISSSSGSSESCTARRARSPAACGRTGAGTASRRVVKQVIAQAVEAVELGAVHESSRACRSAGRPGPCSRGGRWRRSLRARSRTGRSAAWQTTHFASLVCFSTSCRTVSPRSRLRLRAGAAHPSAAAAASRRAALR